MSSRRGEEKIRFRTDRREMSRTRDWLDLQKSSIREHRILYCDIEAEESRLEQIRYMKFDWTIVR